jgi:large subunit ribosomal protein L29
MPLLRLKEMREMSLDERHKKLDEFRTELTRMKTMIGAGGNVENPARIGELHKTIAQILTIDNEQKLGLAKSKSPEVKEKKKAKKPKKKEQKKEKEEKEKKKK